MNRNLLTMAGVSAKLGHRDPEWFARNRARLMQAEGFPAPVRGMGNRWDPAAIDRWLDGQAPVPPAPAAIVAPAAANDAGGDDAAELAAQRAELLRRVPSSVAALRERRQ